MGKIIKVTENVVIVAYTKDNVELTAELPNSELGFTPYVGKDVDVYEHDGGVILNEAEVKREPTKTIPPQLTKTPIETYYAHQSPAAVEPRKFNKMIYILLALFVGGLGMHKFYEGKGGMGFLYILFCWTGIPAIATLFDICCIMFKPSDRNGDICIW